MSMLEVVLQVKVKAPSAHKEKDGYATTPRHDALGPPHDNDAQNEVLESPMKQGCPIQNLQSLKLRLRRIVKAAKHDLLCKV